MDTLRKAGILNPSRLLGLIRKTITFLELDLSGLSVLTEAASGPYVVTPVIAALAGAERVIALTSDSAYASIDGVATQTRALETLCGLPHRIEIETQRSPSLFAVADIVTNLGFVRPIDAEAVRTMKSTTVVSLMYEAWERRESDVDMRACCEANIPVIATNEDYPGLQVFDYCGWLVVKLLLEAQIELHKARIVIVSSDRFGRVAAYTLKKAGVSVQVVSGLRNPEVLSGADALVVADYQRSDMIVGVGGDVNGARLAEIAPAITVVQFAGLTDLMDLQRHGITVYPERQLAAHRMAVTLAGLSAKPVIELNAAGLKVGEIVARLRLSRNSLPANGRVYLREHVLGQVLTVPAGGSDLVSTHPRS